MSKNNNNNPITICFNERKLENTVFCRINNRVGTETTADIILPSQIGGLRIIEK